MALDKLTKVDGGGISTTSDYRVGIITATKFVGPIEGDLTGSITATDGTFSGNVTIGGTLTYEDVTNIDSIGIITARDDVHVGGGVSAVGVGTFSGLDISGDIDVDGHTNLDNVSIAGVTTFASNVFLGDDDNLYLGASNDLRIYHATGAASHINAVGLVNIDGTTGVRLEYNNANRVHCTSTGVTIGGDLDVDAHTNLDNVSIAGVTTAAGTFNVANILQVGTTNNTGEVRIGHDGSNYRARLVSNSSNSLTIDADGPERIQMHGGVIYMRPLDSEKSAAFVANGPAELYHNDIRTAFTDVDTWKVHGRTSNSGMIEVASNQGANNNDRFRIHKTSAASRLTIQNYSTGSWVENIRITAGGAVELKHADGTTHFETTSTGFDGSGSGFNLQASDSGSVNLRLQNSSTGTGTNDGFLIQLDSNEDGYIWHRENKNIIFGTADITRWKIDNNGHFLGTPGGYNIGSTTAEIGNVFLADSKKVFLGSDQDTSIYHDGTHSYFTNTTGNIFVTNSGYTYIDQNHFRVRNAAGNHMIDANNSGTYQGVGLFYTPGSAGTEKLRTSATGITVNGEVATSQEYPDIQPTFDANFAASQTLDPRFTFQRVGPASYTNELGKVVLVGENVPRFDYDLTTRESLGILIEEERTNLFLYGTTPGDNWTGSKAGTFEENTTETTAPDGTFTATKWTFTNTDPYLYQTTNLSANTTSTMSMWVKAGTNMAGDWLQFRIGGAPYSTQGNSIIPADGTWRRITYTRTVGGSAENSASVGFEPQTSPSGNPASGDVIYIWGAQLEVGGYVTSFIPTWGSSTTRGADLLRIMDDEFKDIFGDEFKEFSLVADYDNDFGVGVSGQNYAIFDMWGESTGYNDRIQIFRDDVSPYHIETRAFGQGNALFNNGNVTASTLAKTQRFAASWYVPDYSNTSSRRFVVSMGGEAVDVIADNSGTTVPQLTRMGIGCNPTRLDFPPGLLHFKRLMVYNKTLSDGQLQNLSAQ